MIDIKPPRGNNFDRLLRASGLYPLQAKTLDTIQINVGKLCNQACLHCHVEAGPRRTEIMSKDIMAKCLNIIKSEGVSNVELTGGAPEMNPHFRWLVSELRNNDILVKVRSNLSIMLEPNFTDLPEFLKNNLVEIIASMPCYTRENVDNQRGRGVFEKTIKMLRIFNELGYGGSGSPLLLNLVYNPGGASLPGDQISLENDYRNILIERFGIEFNNLFAITNMPIGRFKNNLISDGTYDKYMNLLVESFNSRSAQQVMCRNLISISWDGKIYDCDFNQMLDLACDHGAPSHIVNYTPGAMVNRRIVTGNHCFGCTAGAGSSCSGALAIKIDARK
ncbi:MAG: radical SAM/Cys-rich domain protein [candidate division Zixibacteria bacterium]|nr:radical SAM/Cys-rich domain protein [candidate division Zixibacteria bacterium]